MEGAYLKWEASGIEIDNMYGISMLGLSQKFNIHILK